MSEQERPTVPLHWWNNDERRQATSEFVLDTFALLTAERDWYRMAWQQAEREKADFRAQRDKLIIELCEQKAGYQALMSKYGAREEEIAVLKARINELKSMTALQEADHGDEKPAAESAAAGG